MKVVIVEDEHLSAQRLQGMLKKYDPSIEVLAELPSVASSVDWFKNNPDPDLILMDIHLEDGQSFSIFETINLQVPVIFTTAFDEYTIKAFKVNSVDYLLKPLNYEELVAAIEKFKRIHGQEEGEEKTIGLEHLLQSMQKKEPEYKSRFLVSIGSRLKTIETEDIQYFFSADKITFLVTKENQRFPIDYSLDKMAVMLDPKQFFRINRQMTVKLEAIKNIHVFAKGKIKLDLDPPTKEDVFVSMDKVVEFKEWLGK
jgi:DNA-binding LytR/AlgR family response regulator